MRGGCCGVETRGVDRFRTSIEQAERCNGVVCGRELVVTLVSTLSLFIVVRVMNFGSANAGWASTIWQTTIRREKKGNTSRLSIDIQDLRTISTQKEICRAIDTCESVSRARNIVLLQGFLQPRENCAFRESEGSRTGRMVGLTLRISRSVKKLWLVPTWHRVAPFRSLHSLSVAMYSAWN